MNYLPSRNVFVIMIFGGGILLLVLLAVFPNYISYNNIEHEIDVLKSRIEEQKILSPIFADLSEKAKFKKSASLPFPKAEKLSKNDADKITPIIREIVESRGFKLESVVTDIESLMTRSGILKITVNLSGAFKHFKHLLLDIGSLPCLDHIEVIQISSYGNYNKFLLTLWILQEQ